MVNYGMLVCSFYLKKRFSRGEENVLPLNNPFSVERDDETVEFENIFSALNDFCLRYSDFSDDERRQKVFSVKEESFQEYDSGTYRCASFIIKSGSYGVEGDITNRHTHEISYHRSENEADIKEFCCVAYVPKNTGTITINKGILVFQSIATYGVKTLTVTNLRSYFSELDLTFETRSVSVGAFIERLVSTGNLYKMTLIRNRISPNLADNLLISTGREESAYIRPNLNPVFLQRIILAFQRADETGVYEMPDGMDCDDISIQFKLGDRLRTVRLKYIDRLSIVEDIPDGIVVRNDASRVIQYMIQTADSYKDRMIFNTNGEV